MAGNLSSVYYNQGINPYSRINLANDSVHSRQDGVGNKSSSNNDQVASNNLKLNQSKQGNSLSHSDYQQNKQRFDDVLERFQKRSVLFQMMETMGGTGTDDSKTGQFLDTYV